MNRYKLQLFAEAVSGKKIVYMYRMLADASKMDAQETPCPLLQKTVSLLAGMQIPQRQKMAQSGHLAQWRLRATTTALLAKGDVMLNKLQDALINANKVEVWKINLEEPGSEDKKYKAKYYWAYVTEFEETWRQPRLCGMFPYFRNRGNRKRWRGNPDQSAAGDD